MKGRFDQGLTVLCAPKTDAQRKAEGIASRLASVLVAMDYRPDLWQVYFNNFRNELAACQKEGLL